MKNSLSIFKVLTALLFAAVFGTIAATAIGAPPVLIVGCLFAASFIEMPTGLSFIGFVVSDLTDYVDQNKTNLMSLTKIVGETGKIMNIQAGIKSAEALQILTVDPIPQSISGCTFTPSGSTAFTQRTITVKPVAFHDKYCLKNLEAKWTQKLLKPGSTYKAEDMPQVIIDEIMKSIQARIETMDWQGNTGSGSSYLNVYDGLIKIIDAATATVNHAAPSTYNATNCRAIIKNCITKIPAPLKGKPEMKFFMGYDAAETYRQALMDANLFHVATGTGDQHGLMAEGSVHQIIPVHGLDGTNRIFVLNPDNAVQGCDMENEEEVYEVWTFTDGTNSIGFKDEFKRGWQIGFPEEIVEYTNA